MIIFLKNSNKNSVYFFIFQVVFASICLSAENVDQLSGRISISFNLSLNENCKTNQFLCKSENECIHGERICDGVIDCTNPPDETTELCQDIECPPQWFKCAYGACIPGRYKCDNVEHCLDGSDECPQLCPNQYKNIKTTPASTTRSCTLPTRSPDKEFAVICPENQRCNNEPGKKVPKFTEITFRCNYGYAHENGNFRSYCSNGTWVPPIAKCSKICKKLKPKNVDLTCSYKNVTVDCEGDLLDGTVVSPTCKPQHYEESLVHYRNICCGSDGEWSNKLPACVPKCGIPFTKMDTLMHDGKKERYGNSPWHVAVYCLRERYPILICSGTIISPYLIVSAAHCFYHEQAKKPYDASDFEVAVSKTTRDYNVRDNPQMKIYKIQTIFFPNTSYYGILTNYAADIALLRVAEKITISPTILPACIQWMSRSFTPPEGTLGKVAGWGQTEKEEKSEILQTANLPYISNRRCVEMVDDDLKEMITQDKFCAGSENGSGVLKGDSGGGLLFRDENTRRYFLRGIVSIKPHTSTSIALFTDLTRYLDWMDSVRVAEENVQEKYFPEA